MQVFTVLHTIIRGHFFLQMNNSPYTCTCILPVLSEKSMKSNGSVLMVTIGACCVMTCCSTCVGWLCVDVARIMVGCFVKMEDRVVVVVIVGSTGSSSVPLFVILSIGWLRLMLISGVTFCGVPVVLDKSSAWLFPKKSRSFKRKILS